MNSELNDNKNKIFTLENLLFAISIFLTFLMSLFLTYRQTIRYDGRYMSDFKAHINLSLSSPYNRRMIVILVKIMDAITHSTLGIAIIISIMASLTIIANYYLIKSVIQLNSKKSGILDNNDKYINVQRGIMEIAALIGLFSGPIYIPRYLEFFYMKTQSKYAWQNPTQIMGTLFAILAFILFIKVYDDYLENFDFKKWLLVSLGFLLSAYAKPSFIMSFYPVVAILLIKDIVISNSKMNFSEKFKKAFFLGSTMIPGFLYFLYLNSSLFGSGNDLDEEARSKVVIDFGRFYFDVDFNIGLSFIAGMAFPILVLVFNINLLKKPYILAGWLNLVFAYAEHFTFAEDGKRAGHGNFAWGKKIGIYIIFVISLGIFIQNIYDKKYLSNKKWLRYIYILAGALLISLHVICNLYYMWILLKGGDYKI